MQRTGTVFSDFRMIFQSNGSERGGSAILKQVMQMTRMKELRLEKKLTQIQMQFLTGID